MTMEVLELLEVLNSADFTSDSFYVGLLAGGVFARRAERTARKYLPKAKQKAGKVRASRSEDAKSESSNQNTANVEAGAEPIPGPTTKDEN